MKTFKIALSAVALLFLNNSLFAQWSITGNNNTTPALNFVGTTNANDLLLKANNYEGIRISSAIEGPRVIISQTEGMRSGPPDGTPTVTNHPLEVRKGSAYIKFLESVNYGFRDILSANGTGVKHSELLPTEWLYLVTQTGLMAAILMLKALFILQNLQEELTLPESFVSDLYRQTLPPDINYSLQTAF